MTGLNWLARAGGDDGALALRGDWRVQHAATIEQAIERCEERCSAIKADQIDSLDAAGALLILHLSRRLEVPVDAIEFKPEHRNLLDLVIQSESDAAEPIESGFALWSRVLARLGSMVSALAANSVQLLGFLGLTLVTLAGVIPRPSRWRITATVHHMQQSGLDALPLVSLLSFLVGAVVAFLGATVLRDFGAELFVVDLTTFAFLREFGVLLTAILLAGRTASAYTAQIGTMKSREEIDAIRTLGQDPMVLLVLPRLIALLIMLPLLSVAATVAGLVGGMAVAVYSLGIPVEMYINRVYETASLSHYLTGLSKAPVFAMVIALIGCLEGFKVTGTAQSVGERTTSAVVQSISLVIIINALAAVFFMEMGW